MTYQSVTKTHTHTLLKDEKEAIGFATETRELQADALVKESQQQLVIAGSTYSRPTQHRAAATIQFTVT